jgi:lipid II:glycine glycyltransferase (peptidoglycan interpeptide bridge formation enzyme)
MLFTLLDEKEYKDFLDKNPYKNFLSHPAIGKHRNDNIKYVGVVYKKRIIAGAMIIIRKRRFHTKEFYIPGGLIMDLKNIELLRFFIKNLKAYSKKEKAFKLKIEFYNELVSRDIDGNQTDKLDNNYIVKEIKKNGFIKSFDEQPRWMHVIDIENKTYDEIFKSMSQNTRNIINKTYRYNIETKKMTKDELKDFELVTLKTSERRNFKNKDLSYYESMYDLLGNEVMYMKAYLNTKEYIKFLKEEINRNQIEIDSGKIKRESKLKNQIELIQGFKNRLKEAEKLPKTNELLMSVAMFITYGNEVIYLFSGNLEEYMNYYPQYQIQNEMIKFACTNNYNRYNFYGISGNFDKNDSRYGVYLFKRGFGGHVVENIGAYELPINKFIYSIFNLRK